MVYISGEEMTKYTCDLILKDWIEPYFTTEKWQHFDMSCVSRDKTNDQVRERCERVNTRVCDTRVCDTLVYGTLVYGTLFFDTLVPPLLCSHV